MIRDLKRSTELWEAERVESASKGHPPKSISLQDSNSIERA